METSFCAYGHQVWWADLDEERVPFVRFTRGYLLVESEEQDPDVPAVARAMRYCWRPHADVCASTEFTKSKFEIQK